MENIDFTFRVLGVLENEVRNLKNKIKRLEEALGKIERWEMPNTNQFHSDGTPVRYGILYGSNGERDVIRKIARIALNGPSKYSQEISNNV